MRLEQVLATWAGDGDSARRIEGGESVGEDFAKRHPSSPSADGAGRLVVERVPGRDISGRVAAIVDGLSDADLAVLLLPAALDQLSPGPVLGSLPKGAHLVGVHDLVDRLGRTALVLTTGEVTSVRTATGVDALELGAESSAAIIDEWLLLGAVQRAQLETSRRQGGGHRAEVELLRQERNTALEELRAERAAHAASTKAARVPTPAATTSAKVRRAARQIAQDPVAGGKALGRAGLRRLGR